jgi:hypothetical protein
MIDVNSELSGEKRDALFKTIKTRFDNNMDRHGGLKWDDVQAKLEANADKVRSLYEMERTGGEPDVVDYDSETGEYIFYDCSPESPKRPQKCLL